MTLATSCRDLTTSRVTTVCLPTSLYTQAKYSPGCVQVCATSFELADTQAGSARRTFLDERGGCASAARGLAAAAARCCTACGIAKHVGFTWHVEERLRSQDAQKTLKDRTFEKPQSRHAGV